MKRANNTAMWRGLIIVLLLSSCVAPKQIRKKARAEGLIDKAVRLNPGVLNETSDTVWQTITIRDTVTQVSFQRDTIVIAPTEGDTIRITDPRTQASAWLVFHKFTPQLGLDVPQLQTVRDIQTTVPAQVRTRTVTRSNWWRWLRAGYRWTFLLAIVVVVALVAYLVSWLK